jgi:hypothetical protein
MQFRWFRIEMLSEPFRTEPIKRGLRSIGKFYCLNVILKCAFNDHVIIQAKLFLNAFVHCFEIRR